MTTMTTTITTMTLIMTNGKNIENHNKGNDEKSLTMTTTLTIDSDNDWCVNTVDGNV